MDLVISMIKLFDSKFTTEITYRDGLANCITISGEDSDLQKGQFPIHISRFDYDLFNQEDLLIKENLNEELGGKKIGYEVVIFENR